ncbi:MAG: FtsQ-type POTRA domain-containing protein [Gloeomargarita sp. SKYBB_i_bin120]|nr:FtsQ-type POTRA domain-containing protein [Gloeomargarita sp. SKYG98]MCS7292866.1 FtsQ-type POTRA domain-containing protein [Gloeomargarita sp. SKYB120]MDW8178429.1 FtsQ-type POTRA domain-containing protein [Gloeomargarita sp. SKYBB_i_bin120]
MDFQQRRRQIRRQRRRQLLLEVWQTLATAGVAAGLVWLVQHPSWWVVQPEQIRIHTEGLLTETQVRQWLQFDQPQPLWQLSPTVLTARLQQQPVVADVRVRRRAFPARVELWVQERWPVAVLTCTQPCPSEQQGFLDAEGHRLGAEYAPVLRQLQRYPVLQVRGWHPTQASLWPQVYRAIATSPVRVTALDWEQPGDLRLQTELGWIRLGSDVQQLPAQLLALDRLRHLPRQVPLQRIAAIDLSDPQAPLIELRR